MEPYHTFRRYGQSKLANILHARELQRRYPQITATSVHPGVIITDLYAAQQESNPFMRITLPLAKSMLTDVPGGAKNTLWAATSNKEVVRMSHYWKPVGNRNGGSFWYAQKEDLAKELWEWTEEQFKDIQQ